MLTVDIASLSPGIHHVEFAPAPEEVDLDPSMFSDLQVEVELQYHRDRILVKMQAAATATLTCDRTLKEYEQPVAGGYSLLFGPPEMVGQEGEAFEEVRPLTPSDTELDLTDVVRDTLVLALPQRRIAPEAEGEPVERVFGAPAEEEESDDPVDPRWSELEKLREEDREDEENTPEERQF
ncbi:MAG: YceD family protein [Salinivenus sp.]